MNSTKHWERLAPTDSAGSIHNLASMRLAKRKTLLLKMLIIQNYKPEAKTSL